MARKATQPKRVKTYLRRGDRVRVMRGRDAGKEGTILRVDRKRGRVVVEGVNLRKRHLPPRGGEPGQIVTFEAPIHVSNVMLLDPVDGKPTRVRFRRNPDGTKDRIAVRSGAVIPKATN